MLKIHPYSSVTEGFRGIKIKLITLVFCTVLTSAIVPHINT
jgi:hypothetical protein